MVDEETSLPDIIEDEGRDDEEDDLDHVHSSTLVRNT